MAAEQDEWHPFHRTLWERCRAKPDAREDHPWGDTVFKVNGRIFAFLGDPQRPSVTVKAPPDELEILLAASFIRRSRYIGRYGWVTLAVADEDALALALDLIDDSYETIARRRKRTPPASSRRR